MKASRHNSPNLDILRAIAVLTVVVDHLIPTFAFRGYVIPHTVSELTLHIGQSGVLAFFVHTSLVLMYSLERIPAPTHWAQAWRFYARRAFRIYPLALVCVVAVVALGWPEASWKPYHPVTWQEVVANLMLVQNLWTGHSVLTPLWSLPYEVEMYLVLPVAYLIARRKDGLTWMIALVVASTLAGYAFGKLKHGHMNLAAYVPCFLAGVTCYLVRDRVRPRIAGRWWPLFVIGAVSAYCVVHTVSDRLIYWIGWIYCIGIAAAIPMFQDSASAWINRVAATVAKYSYGIYLLHAPALYVVFGLWQPGPLVVEVPLFVALTAVLSVAAYHLIEEPLVRVGRRLAGAGRSGARAGLIPEGCAGGCDNRSRRGGRALQPPMRLRRIAVALGTLTAASVLAHAERVAAKRMMMEPADISPPGFQLAGRALGGATPPAGIEVAAAAHLAGSAIGMTHM
jgi:peptidoglycan/LPS O-acetylase OafA/YrhL